MGFSSQQKKDKLNFEQALTKVNSIVKPEIYLRRLDKVHEINEYNYTCDDGKTVIPDEVYQLVKNRKSVRYRVIVYVTDKKLLGNLFFQYFNIVNTNSNDSKSKYGFTICTINDWNLYSPPSITAYLLYVSLKSYLFLNNDYLNSHFDTRGCIMDYCQIKSDIRIFLSPSNFDSIRKELFCSDCQELNSKGNLSKKKTDREQVLFERLLEEVNWSYRQSFDNKRVDTSLSRKRERFVSENNKYHDDSDCLSFDKNIKEGYSLKYQESKFYYTFLAKTNSMKIVEKDIFLNNLKDRIESLFNKIK